jgi:hypothetical protein
VLGEKRLADRVTNLLLHLRPGPSHRARGDLLRVRPKSLKSFLITRLDVVGPSLDSKLSKGEHLLGVHRPDRWPANVGKDQSPHFVLLRLAGDVENATVATGSARETNRAIPTRGFRKHQVGSFGPSGESEKLGRPDHLFLSDAQQIAKRRMRRVNGWVGMKRQTVGGIGRHMRRGAASFGQFPDITDEFTLLVSNQPGVERALNDGPGAAIKHDAAFRELDQETRRAVSWGIHRSDPQESKTDFADFHGQVIRVVPIPMTIDVQV